MDDEDCFCSVYELIYSYRNSINDTIPNFRSINAVEALNNIYYIKENMSSGITYINI